MAAAGTVKAGYRCNCPHVNEKLHAHVGQVWNLPQDQHGRLQTCPTCERKRSRGAGLEPASGSARQVANLPHVREKALTWGRFGTCLRISTAGCKPAPRA